MNTIRVLVIAGAMNVGGIENQLMHLLRQADKNQFQIDFTTTEDHPFYQEEMLSLGAKCIQIPKTEGKHFLRYCRALYHVMRESNYDIVHSHELFHSGMVLLTARIAGVKHRFVHAHNWKDSDDPSKKQSFKRRMYNRIMKTLIQKNATEFIACSTFAGEFLYGKKILEQDNYHLIFNSVDTTKFIDKFDQKETGDFCEDGWINVLQVGRFTPVKNQLFTAEIAKELKTRNRRIRVLCAGNTGGDYEDSVRRKIEEYGIEENMMLLGVRKDVDTLMRKSKVFLLPSLYEGMPLVLIEAQASGLPCVTADTYSHEVDFNIGTVKWMSLDDAVSEWADAIESAVRKNRSNKTTVINAIQEGGFDSRLFAEKVCELYETSIEND